VSESLAGKWIWAWNWRRCDGGDPQAVATRLKSAGCRGALVKAFDGGHWFDQGLAFRDIARRLHARGVGAGAWGYLYGEDTAAEAARAIETAQCGEADLLVLDVESEFKGHPEAALDVCRRIREALGPRTRCTSARSPSRATTARFRSSRSGAIARARRRRCTGTPSAGRSHRRLAGRTTTTARCRSRAATCSPSAGCTKRARSRPITGRGARVHPLGRRSWIARGELLKLRAHGQRDVAGRRSRHAGRRGGG